MITVRRLNLNNTLREDTLALYDALCDLLGLSAFGQLITYEYPWLLKPETPLIRIWLILQRKHDEVLGIEHRGLYIVTPLE